MWPVQLGARRGMASSFGPQLYGRKVRNLTEKSAMWVAFWVWCWCRHSQQPLVGLSISSVLCSVRRRDCKWQLGWTCHFFENETRHRLQRSSPRGVCLQGTALALSARAPSTRCSTRCSKRCQVTRQRRRLGEASDFGRDFAWDSVLMLLQGLDSGVA